MNVDKWAWCGQFLLINRPGTVIVLDCTPDESCDCIIVQVRFWIELPIQRRLCPIFVKLWIPVNGTNGVVSSYTISTGFPWVNG